MISECKVREKKFGSRYLGYKRRCADGERKAGEKKRKISVKRRQEYRSKEL